MVLHLLIKTYQIIINAQAFGERQEPHTLQPVFETIQERYTRLGINDDLYQTGIIATADTSFTNEDNMENAKTTKKSQSGYTCQ